jgi:hypothetical protein
MSYDAFLVIMSQLAGHRKARVVINGEVIFFEPSEKKNHWTLYTKVFVGEGFIPKSVRACVSSGGILRWQANGAYLKLDIPSHCVYLIQEVEMQDGKYIPFKHYLSDFSAVADEWREILQDIAEGDYTSAQVS